MESPVLPLFAPAALAVLNSQPYDPAAKGRYELMSGGLIWGDEFPKPGTPERAIVELRVGRLAGRTVEAWRRGDEALVPMDAFLALAEYRWRPAGNTLEVTWPRQRAPLRLAPGDTLVEVPGRGPVRLPPDVTAFRGRKASGS